MISIYVDDFLLASKLCTSFDWIKKNLKNEYNIKDLGDVKTIIGWQMTWNWDAAILKIDQSMFIQNWFEEENLTDCNVVNIHIKACSFIEIHKKDDYKKTNIKIYQQLNKKIIQLLCNTRYDIAFAME